MECFILLSDMIWHCLIGTKLKGLFLRSYGRLYLICSLRFTKPFMECSYPRLRHRLLLCGEVKNHVVGGQLRFDQLTLPLILFRKLSLPEGRLSCKRNCDTSI